MQGSGIRKVSRAELHCFVLEMLADESDLLRIVWVFCDDLLHTSAFGHLENVLGLAQIEGHYLASHMMHHCLMA